VLTTVICPVEDLMIYDPQYYIIKTSQKFNDKKARLIIIVSDL